MRDARRCRCADVRHFRRAAYALARTRDARDAACADYFADPRGACAAARRAIFDSLMLRARQRRVPMCYANAVRRFSRIIDFAAAQRSSFYCRHADFIFRRFSPAPKDFHAALRAAFAIRRSIFIFARA
ncbi:hypothetical protein NPIL_481341 [Nephila pilipes]|uniref:Uncharacterized protein n=1 Tax=Nephila pilipes TaxID=299642 RepID=A0A8X6NIY4_NEPPI|nr:hypothetical protein NPIL_481341 [Nephila pilipes]